MKHRLLCSKLRVVLPSGLENKVFLVGLDFDVDCDR
jgi:hypothetical protein